MKLLHTLTEGGQTWAHRVRMVKQVLKMTLSFSFLTAAIYGAYALCHLDSMLLTSSYYHVKARLCNQVFFNRITVDPKFWEKIAREKIVKEKAVSTDLVLKLTYPKITVLISETKKIFAKSILFAVLSFSIMLIYFIWRGASSKRKKHVAGKKIVHPVMLKCLLWLKQKRSDIRIGTIPLVKGTETQHILISGGTGSGKTNCFHHFLHQLKNNGQKSVIIDTTGAFIERYFNSSTDFILNPFDNRGALWHPWIECTNNFDYDNLSESLIPQSNHDHENYWRTAARTLFSSLLHKLSKTNKTSELSRWILFEPLEKLAEFVQDTKAAAHIDVSSEKTAASIRSVAASFLSCLEYLKDTEASFSIKKWVHADDKQGWLFLHSKPAQRAALNPLLSSWFSIAVRSLIQMEPNLQRRIWFVVDELPTLQKLKELESLVTESRKFGGCALLALQSPSQLEEIYGHATASTIIGNCATRIIFAEHDPEIAGRISKSLGDCEIKEYQEGISYGAHEVRDGVSLSLQAKKIPLVSATDIQSLENNNAYIKLPGNLPISKIKLKIG